MSKPRELHDRYFRLAKAEGYLARSAYKLKQIQQRYRVLRRGDWVLDLGCAPGSWMQVAGEIVGDSGLVVGIDLLPAKLAPTDRIAVLQGDAFGVPPADLLSLLPEPQARFNAVISDMAPNTVGIGDDLRSASLCRRVLGLLPSVLAEGGRLTMKIFEGAEYPNVLNEARSMFTYCKGYRPDATREISREMFIVAEGFHAPTGAGRRGPAGPPALAAGWGSGGTSSTVQPVIAPIGPAPASDGAKPVSKDTPVESRRTIEPRPRTEKKARAKAASSARGKPAATKRPAKKKPAPKRASVRRGGTGRPGATRP